MAWLLRRGEVLASLELAEGLLGRARGFAGHEHERAALLLAPAHAAHSIGVRCPLDVAYLDKELRVLATTRLAPFRVAMPRRGAASILEVEAGAFERWRLAPGDALEVQR
jgi:uncharacterized membrane protein (UPF0127 family)